MRNLKTGLITLAASAAILVPGAAANAQSASTASSSKSSSVDCVVGVLSCFDLYTGDILSDNDVDITTAISFCGVQVQVLGIGQWMDCGGGKKVHRKS